MSEHKTAGQQRRPKQGASVMTRMDGGGGGAHLGVGAEEELNARRDLGEVAPLALELEQARRGALAVPRLPSASRSELLSLCVCSVCAVCAVLWVPALQCMAELVLLVQRRDAQDLAAEKLDLFAIRDDHESCVRVLRVSCVACACVP